MWHCCDPRNKRLPAHVYVQLADRREGIGDIRERLGGTIALGQQFWKVGAGHDKPILAGGLSSRRTRNTAADDMQDSTRLVWRMNW